MDPNLLRHLERGHRYHVPGRRRERIRWDDRRVPHRPEREDRSWI
jgi:hypothetical protein